MGKQEGWGNGSYKSWQVWPAAYASPKAAAPWKAPRGPKPATKFPAYDAQPSSDKGGGKGWTGGKHKEIIEHGGGTTGDVQRALNATKKAGAPPQSPGSGPGEGNLSMAGVCQKPRERRTTRRRNAT